MPDGGTLAVHGTVVPSASARRGEGPPRPLAKITISDSGPGILPEHFDRIFEPYFTTKEGGTGLGLALAHKIIQEHDGSIEVESVASGATFVVALPVVGPAPPAKDAQPSGCQPGTPGDTRG
jgi:signal transduction histidine kinase